MTKGLEDDKEKALLMKNPDLVPLLLVNVDELLLKKEEGTKPTSSKDKLVKKDDIEI